MRIVFDTNIAVRAINHGRSPAAEAIRLCLAQGHQLVSSKYLIDEITRVLEYPRVKALSKSTDEERDAAFAEFRTSSKLFDVAEIPVVSTDADDNPIIGLALAGSADVICTKDNHFHQPAVRFLLDSKGIRVLTDVELLRELRVSAADGLQPP